MSIITIQVPSENYEMVNVELSDAQVLQLYQLRQVQINKIVELEKEVEKQKGYYKTCSDSRADKEKEIGDANTLLTALGVAAKTEAAESWSQRDLPLVTRLALYIAQKA